MVVIEEGEEREAEHVETTDYFFDKIGESVPLCPNNPSFDLQNPPSLPLAVSERYRLIFVAIDNGFCVAKTADVINLAKDIKSGRAAASSSVLDVCIVQVLIGRISILCLSTDSSMLAASVGGDIYFFSVESLLHKEKEPHLSLSIESPSRVKYICWTKKKETSFVVLSNTGTLYSGDLQHPLKQVMDDVDAVDWSIKGEFLAVASKQVLSILTPEFNKSKQILLQFKLGFADADEGSITVDSIQWVRSDCIVVGSLQQMVDGKEENYVVQVITCENGEEITDASSTLVTLCLSDLFLSIVDDIMPFGHGPYLQLSYLETRQLAVLANKKNTDQHITLVGWLEDSEGPAVVHIERDDWLPRIELQENDDDNVLLALCIDRASVYENIKVNLGEDDERELSPHCIFLCLTHEGKLVIFHFASISGNSEAPSAVPVCSDEETISTTRAPDLPTISVEEKDDKTEQIVSDLASPDMNRDKSAAAEVDEKHLQKNSEPGSSVVVDETLGGECVKEIPPKSFVVDDSKLGIENYNEAEKVNPGGSSSTSDYPVQKDFPFSSSHVDKSKVELDKSSGGVQSETKETKQFTPKSFAADSLKLDPENYKEAEKPRVEGLRSFSDFPAGKISFNQSQGEESKNSVKLGFKLGGGQLGNENLKQIPQKGYAEKAFQIGAGNLNKAENLKLIGLTSAFDVPVGKNSLFNSNLSHAEMSKNSTELGNRESSSQATSFRNVLEQGTTNFSGFSGSSGTAATNAGRATPVTANTAMGINSLQGKQSVLPVVSHVAPMNVNLRSPSNLTHSKVESSLSKKYGNINDMTSELDKLLQSIEEPGGFMDTCSSSQKLLQNLEQTVTVLSHKCTMSQSLIHEQGETIQHLLDNTVQVLARRIYMEGIVKQTRDKNYWDLWNRQKLSSELQMRRQSMINLSQDLINQLIDLEKHFNALELNKYSESSGVNTGGQSYRSKYPPSRKIQSLHAVHNSLHSQLAAAEQLSDCLSKQMSALSITSSLVKTDNVKDQLFKLIGLPCESHSETSIQSQKLISGDRPYVAPSFSPVSSTKGKNLRSNQTGNSNNHEPETVRRRRDSFGQNWASFEPSKTTIKRIQRESERSDVKRPSLLMDKRFSISSSADGSVDAGDATQLDLFHDTRVVEDTSKNFTPRGSSKSSRANNIPEPRVSSVNNTFGKQVFSPERSNQERSTSFENQDSGLSKERKTSFTVKTQPSLDQQNVQRAQSLVSPFSKITNSMPMSDNSKDSTSAKRGGGGSNISGQKVSSTLPFSSGSFFGTESSQPAVFSQPAVPINETKTSSNSTTNFSSMVSSVANSATKSPFSLSSSTPSDQKFSFNITAGTLNSSPGNQNELKSATQSTSLATSSTSSSNSIVKPLDQSSADKVGAAGSNFSHTSSFKPADTVLSKPHETPPMSFFTKPTLKTPSKEPPKSELGWNTVTLTNSYSVTPNIELKKTAEVIVFPQAQVSTAQEVEVEVDKDEMEEEAPLNTTSQTPNFSLGSFGGLGLGGGSNPNNNTSSPFGSNPFGGPSVSITAPVMDMAVPGGQLFKPASFSIPTPQLQAQSTIGFGTSLGQPAQTGSGLQALGSVLGSFGQSRQLGPTALPAANPGGGFGAATPPAGGFGGGFAGVGPTPAAATATSGFGGGFAGVGATTGGFSAAATAGGFAGAGGGGGFGAFGGGGGGGGFSSFGSGAGAPKELFTQMRK